MQVTQDLISAPLDMKKRLDFNSPWVQSYHSSLGQAGKLLTIMGSEMLSEQKHWAIESSSKDAKTGAEAGGLCLG